MGLKSWSFNRKFVKFTMVKLYKYLLWFHFTIIDFRKLYQIVYYGDMSNDLVYHEEFDIKIVEMKKILDITTIDIL